MKISTNIIKAGYVYVIKDQTNGRKLGFSAKPEIRVKQLQTGNKERLVIEYRLPVQNMTIAENALHTLFSAYKIRDEWFHLQEKDLLLLRKVFKDMVTTEREEKLLKSLGLR